MTGRPLWREDTLQANASAKGQTNFDANTRIDTATLNIKSGYDQIEAQTPGAGQGHARRRRLAGRRHDARATCRTGPPGWPPGCRRWAAASLPAATSSRRTAWRRNRAATCGRCSFAAAPLIVKSPWVNLNEQRIDGDRSPARGTGSSGVCNSRRRLSVARPPRSTPRTSSWPCRPTRPMELAGALDYQGDVGRDAAMVRRSGQSAVALATGRTTQRARPSLQQTAGVVQARPPPKSPIWPSVDSSGKQITEPIVRLVARGNYDTKSEVLQLSQLRADVQRDRGVGRRQHSAQSADATTPNSTERSITTWSV